MKITDIVYKSFEEVREMQQWDMKKLPIKPKWYLQLLAWILSFPETFTVKSKIHKVRMEGLKGPYILLCNHNSFVDFKVATKAIFPRKANYIVAIDGYIGREWLLRNVGGIPTRKFISDSSIFRQIKHTLDVNKTICEIYPEARYSLIGTTAVLPDSLGKLCKITGYPVVTLISHGHHLRQPVWNLNYRKIKSTTEMTQILTKEELQEKSVDEINQIIRDNFVYDDYQYQYENKIKIDYEDRALNLHKILYKCPNCETEFKMSSKGHTLTCNHCKTTYEMDEYGRLSNTKFSHIPDWYEWQRGKVKEEILTGNYNVELKVNIDILPNSTGFYRLGQGTVTHDLKGFTLRGKDFSVDKSVLSNYGLHLEFDYFGRGDGFSFSTLQETYYMYPINQQFAVTKLHFAVEELYKLEINKKGK